MKRSIVFLPLLFAACASMAPANDAEQAIRKADADLTVNARAGNAAVLAAVYADDAVIMPPNAPAVRGPEAIRQFWTGFLGLGQIDLALTIDKVTQSGDLAAEIGRYEMTITPKGAAPIHDKGKYLVAWRKTGGAWKIIGDIFNSDLPK
jgi:ketosteroid isomerase-like protein